MPPNWAAEIRTAVRYRSSCVISARQFPPSPDNRAILQSRVTNASGLDIFRPFSLGRGISPHGESTAEHRGRHLSCWNYGCRGVLCALLNAHNGTPRPAPFLLELWMPRRPVRSPERAQRNTAADTFLAGIMDAAASCALKTAVPCQCLSKVEQEHGRIPTAEGNWNGNDRF
jgi:hypothetical protein